MRVGLVLGAGGVVGASWLIGALEALQDETGWDPTEAEVIVGTSAGSVVGALTASGLPPAYMAAYVAGHEVDEIAAAARRAGERSRDIDDALELARVAESNGGPRPDGSGYRLARALPPIGPGSWRLVFNTPRHPQRPSGAAPLCGWLPRGLVPTGPITEVIRAFLPRDRAHHDNYSAVAAGHSSRARRA